MSINFILNDPAVAGMEPQTIDASADRPASKARFAVTGLPAEGVYPPTSDEFVAWQAREGAIRALDTFEAIAGPLVGWKGSARSKVLKLHPNHGQDLNAYYDRSSVAFFSFPLKGSLVYSGASTDVVAHEVGHAILDALRPDLWNVSMLEVGAFHEGFGDCIAIMTALSDLSTRQAILQQDATLQNPNYVEATAEQLSAAVSKAISPNHSAAKPRRGLNLFEWDFPENLPDNAKPGVLINEVHSFGQLTSGCYYDLILEIFRAGVGGEHKLWEACQTATRLLVEGTKIAPIKARFLDSIGRSMILADRATASNADGVGKNEAHIKVAFANHGISLSSTAMLAPKSILARSTRGSKAKTSSQRSPNLSSTAKENLRSILDADAGVRLTTRSLTIGKVTETEVVTNRNVDLSGIHDKLENVKAITPQSALVGTVGGATALLGGVDPSATISAEVRAFVEMLVRREQIAFNGQKRSSSKSAGSGYLAGPDRPTHALRHRGDEVVLERISFRCGCSLHRKS